MEYRVKVIGVQPEVAKIFYISSSFTDWLTVNRRAAAIYHSPESARCTIDQGIESIKQKLDLYYHCELEEIQIVEEVTTELAIQTLKPSEI